MFCLLHVAYTYTLRLRFRLRLPWWPHLMAMPWEWPVDLQPLCTLCQYWTYTDSCLWQAVLQPGVTLCLNVPCLCPGLPVELHVLCSCVVWELLSLQNKFCNTPVWVQITITVLLGNGQLILHRIKKTSSFLSVLPLPRPFCLQLFMLNLKENLLYATGQSCHPTICSKFDNVMWQSLNFSFLSILDERSYI